MHMETSWKSLQYMLYLLNVEDSPVSDNINFPSGVMFMSELWPSSNHRNTVGRFVQLGFVDVVVWESIYSPIHHPTGVIICAVTS